MRTLILLFFVSTLALTWSSPIDSRRWLINRPNEDVMLRNKRDNLDHIYTARAKQPHPPPYVRKGEYLCDGKVCKLKAGESSRFCNGLCQFPLPHRIGR